MTQQKESAEPDVQQLIDIGKQRGYVTYEEMNNFLPTHLMSSDRLDDVMIMFSDMDIEIVNEARKRAEAERRGVPKPGEENGTGKPGTEAARSNDPVRVYLRKMGSVALLSREGEIEIAKRIEDGEYGVKRIALTSALGVQFVDDLIYEDEERIQKAMKSGKRPRPTRTRSGKTLVEVKSASDVCLVRLHDLRDEQEKAKSKKRRQEVEETITETEDELLSTMESLDLSKKQIAQISQRIQDSW